MDLNGVLSAVFSTEKTDPSLRVTFVAADPPPVNAATLRDENGATAQAYDAATNSLRVTAV